jgi:hypothetical protein
MTTRDIHGVERAFGEGLITPTPGQALAPLGQPSQELLPGRLGQDPDALGLMLGETQEERNFRLEQEKTSRGITFISKQPAGQPLKSLNDELQAALRKPEPNTTTFSEVLSNLSERLAKEPVALARSISIPTLTPSVTAGGFQLFPTRPGGGFTPIPQWLGGTGERAAVLREQGAPTLKAALQAAEEDPLPTFRFPVPIPREVQAGLLAAGVTQNDLAAIQQAAEIPISTNFIAEMALDYINAFALLGPAVKTTRIGIEFAEAALRAAIRNPGEALEQLAKRLIAEQAYVPSGVTQVPAGGALVPRVPSPTTAGREVPKNPNFLDQAARDWRATHGVTPPPYIPVTDSTTLSPERTDEIIDWFAQMLASPLTLDQILYTKTLQANERAKRISNFSAALQQGIDDGLGPEEAYRFAIKEMQGKLPGVNTGLAELATEEVRSALFSKIQADLIDDPLELMDTMTALKNALDGIAIPRTPGTTGQSAYSRLQRVFPPHVMDALDSTTDFDTLIGLKMGQAPSHITKNLFPTDPATATDVPFMQAPFEGIDQALTPGPTPLIPDAPQPSRGIPDDPRTPAQRELDLQQMRLELQRQGLPDPWQELPVVRSGAIPPSVPFGQRRLTSAEIPSPRQFPEDPRSAQQKAFDIGMFEAAIKGQVPMEPGSLLSKLDDIDDTVIKQVALMPDPQRNLLIQTLKVAGLNAMDAGNFLRANMASFDLSWLRQQALMIFGNTHEFGPAVADSLRAVWTQKFADDIMAAIDKHPLKAMYDELGLDFLRPLAGEVADLTRASEDFMALAVVKGQEKLRPFQRLAQNTPWIRISGRAHVVGTNSMNWRMFTAHYERMLRIQERIIRGEIKLKPEEVFDPVHEMKAYGEMLAEMSGRGPLGPLKELSPALNAGFFSLRLMIGRLISPRHLFAGTPLWPSGSKHVRKQAWKNFLSAIAGFGGILLAGKQMGLWDVELDRRSADFMKILLNNGRTRIDPWGGFQQYVVLFGRLLQETPSYKSTTTGQIIEEDPLALVGRSLRSKMHPSLSNTLEFWVEEDFKGSEIDRKDWLRWLKRNSPLGIIDIYEAFDAEGLVGILPGSTGVIGAGVQTHELPRWKELDRYYSFSVGRTAEQARALRKIFRWNPTNDQTKLQSATNEAKLFIRGHVETLSSELAGRIVIDLMRELKLNPKDVAGYASTFGDHKELPPEQPRRTPVPPTGPFVAPVAP